MPVIALFGCPNVGKSTLFNRLTRTRDALVANFPRLTRDRQYGRVRLEGHDFIVIDTGGWADEAGDIDGLVTQQSMRAVEEADMVLFVVDARQGMNSRDELIAGQLRRTGKMILPVVNKIDGVDELVATGEFHALGLGNPVAIAASQGRGMRELTSSLLSHFGLQPMRELPNDEQPGERNLTIAVIGRPNVGKSTLINRLLREERLVAHDQPGTTRDSIHVSLTYKNEPVMLVDTAGVRRRGRIRQVVEKFSVVKTLQAVDQSNVVIMMLDAREGIVDQDASLLGYILEHGRALVMAVNKWDRLSQEHRRETRRQLERKLIFTEFADMHFISAKYGSGVFDVIDSAVQAYQSAFRRYSTPDLNHLLEDLLSEHQPPLVRGRRAKLRYMHQGGVNPPRFIIHGNQTESIPDSYRRYLVNRIRQQLRIRGTPVRVDFRGGNNPFMGLRKKPRQAAGSVRKRRKHRCH